MLPWPVLGVLYQLHQFRRKELEASRCQEASAVKAIGGERTLWMNSILPRSAEMLLGTRSY